MEQLTAFLHFLLFLLTSCTLRINGLSPDIINIQSSSSCTVDNTSSGPTRQFCFPPAPDDNESSCYRCADTTSDINNIIDGLSDTTWSSRHVNELPNGTAEIYIEFNKLYVIQSVMVFFVTPPPLQWSIDYYNITDELVEPVLLVVNDSSINCLPDYPVCKTRDSTFTEFKARGIRLSFMMSSPPVVDERESFYSISEVIIEGYCADDCEICGRCVSDQVDRLINISSSIKDVILPRYTILIITNETDINLISHQTSVAQAGVLEGEFYLIAAERDYGLLAEYPLGVSIPMDISRFDNLYDNDVLMDIRIIEELLTNTTQFDYLTGTVNAVTMNSREVTQLLNNIKDPSTVLNETRILLAELLLQLNQLMLHSDRLDSAKTEGDLSLTTILARMYTDIEQQLDHLINISMIFDTNLIQHDMRSLIHVEISRNTSNAVSEYKRLIPAVIDVLNNIMINISDIRDNVNNTDRLIQDIENLLDLHSSLLSYINININESLMNINETSTVLTTIRNITQISESFLTTLHSYVTIFNATLHDYSTDLSPFTPPLFPLSCNNTSTTCTLSESHSLLLADNLTLIQHDSDQTLTHAERFLSDIADLTDSGFDSINDTANTVIELSQSVLGSLRDIDLNVLESNTASLQTDVTGINAESLMLISDAEILRNDSLMQYDWSVELRDQYQSLFTDFGVLTRGVNDFMIPTNITLESMMIDDTTDRLISDLDAINISVNSNRLRMISLNEAVTNINNIINDTIDVYQYTQDEIPPIHEVLNTTGAIMVDTGSDLDSIMRENNDILSEIDTLLETISDTHKLVQKINSPVRLQQSSSTVSPYISLQPPPGVTNITQGVQFQSLDMYLFPAAGYSPPSLLFYAGPIVKETESDQSSLALDDYIALTSESSQSLLLQWRINGVSNSVSRTGGISGHTEVYFTSVGSMFELQLIEPDQGPPSRYLSLINGSLLFKPTERTVYLLGGQPVSSSLAIPGTYSSYIGLVHLLLFNGNLWSLWNYRNRSDTVFTGGFLRDSDGALDNVWIPDRTPVPRTNVLSFDGDGSYIKPVRFYHTGSFDGSGTLRFTLYIKSLEGLVAYLYDPVSDIRLELALYQGNVIMIVSGPGFDTLRLTTPISGTDFTGRSYFFEFSGNNIRYTASGRSRVLHTRQGFRFFTDLTRIEAWFGGMAPPTLSSLGTSLITNTSYEGCLDVDLSMSLTGPRVDILSDNFINNYLSSTTQKGVTGTCLITQSSHDVSFSGSGYLSYSSYQFITKVNDPDQQVSLDGDRVVFSFSFYPLEGNGIILHTTSQQDNSILIGVRDTVIQVELCTNDICTSVSTDINIEEWNHLILEINSSNYKLFMNGVLRGVANTPSGFSFTSDGTSSLYIGGSPTNRNTNFTGCIRELTYNFQSLQLISRSLSSYVPPVGVSFDDCVFINERTSSLVDVFASTPQDRSCFMSKPVELTGTVGGFHTYSSLLSYNGLPLKRSSWSLSFSLRRLSGDSHVITISSKSGVSISIALISNGIIDLRLRGENGSDEHVSADTPLAINTWNDIFINSTIINGVIIINLLINGDTIGTVITKYTAGNIFEPSLPLGIGYKEKEEVLGFAGCLRDLKLNNDSMTFDKEELSSCISCYSNAVGGWGFSGLSYIKKMLVLMRGARYLLSLKLLPMREHGLLLLITNNITNTPLLGIGLYEGEVRVTNFTVSGGYITQSQGSLCSLMESSVFSLLNVTVSQTDGGGYQFIVSLNDTMMELNTNNNNNNINNNNNVDLYIGGIPNTGLYSSDTDYFAFMVRGTNGLPPRFIGCVQQPVLTSSSSQLNNELNDISQTDMAHEIMVGLCPSP